MNPVLFGDIEVELADYLAARLAEHDEDAAVCNAVPDPRPARFVVVHQPGGAEANIIVDRPVIVVECHDTTGTGASALAQLVRALIRAAAPGWVGAVWVGRVKPVGFAKSTDPLTKLPRYLVTCELWVSGAEIT